MTILSEPLVINFVGPPGAGKSTTSGEVFVALKRLGVDVELVTEYAKDLTWEERHIALACQPYIWGKQLRNQERLHGKVNVIVTDSPLLLSAYYTLRNCPEKYPPEFVRLVIDQYRRERNKTYLLKRVKPYNPRGRSQTEAESDGMYPEIDHFLYTAGVQATRLDAGPEIWRRVVRDTLAELERLGVPTGDASVVLGPSSPLPETA